MSFLLVLLFLKFTVSEGLCRLFQAVTGKVLTAFVHAAAAVGGLWGDARSCQDVGGSGEADWSRITFRGILIVYICITLIICLGAVVGPGLFFGAFPA